ncbi:MAG: hypothetical protein ACE5HV_06750 [Acidobacteriota bacterium]
MSSTGSVTSLPKLYLLAPLAAGLGVATWATHLGLAPGIGVGDPTRVAEATLAAPSFLPVLVLTSMAMAVLWWWSARALARAWQASSATLAVICSPLLWGLALPAVAMVVDAAAFRCVAPPLAALGLGLGGLVSARGLSRLRKSSAGVAEPGSGTADRARLGLAVVAAMIPIMLVGGWPAPSGDEPHYLLVAHSIWYDGDLDLADDYASRAYLPYHQEFIFPHAKPGRVAGRRYSMHGVGLPLLLLPSYVLGRGIGGAAMVTLPRANLALLYGLFAWALFGLIDTVAGRRAALRGTAATTLLSPLLFAPLYLFPEVPAMLLSCLAFAAGRAPRRTGAVVAAGLALAALPWLGVKYIPLALALAAVGLLEPAEVGRGRRGLILSLALLLSLGGHALFTLALYGSPSPLSLYLGSDAAAVAPALGNQWGAYLAAWRQALATLLGYLMDQKEGLLAYGPHFLLATAGLPWLWRKRRTDLLALTFVGLAYIGPYALSQQLGGQGPPVRPMMAIIWLLAVPLGVALALPGRCRRWFDAGRGMLLAVAGCLTLAYVTRPSLLPHDYPVKSSHLLAAYASAGSGWWRLFPQWVNVDEPHWRVASAWALGIGVVMLLLASSGSRRSATLAQPRAVGKYGLDGSRGPAARPRATRVGWCAAGVMVVVLCGGVVVHHLRVVVTGLQRGTMISSAVTAWVEDELPARAWAESTGVWVRPGRPVSLLLTSDRPLESVDVRLQALVESEVEVSLQGARLGGVAGPGQPLGGRLLPGRGWRFRNGYAYHCLLVSSRGAAPAALGSGADERVLGVFLRLKKVEFPARLASAAAAAPIVTHPHPGQAQRSHRGPCARTAASR